jgi:hypothetical protein
MGATRNQPCHVSGAGSDKVTVPAHKPIKPVYVRQFVALIDSLENEGDE